MATNNRPLKAYVRFDGSGRVVAGSLILRKQKPKVGKWQEIPAFECCNYVPTTTTTTTFNPVSDKRLKENIVPTGNFIGEFTEYTWNWNAIAKDLNLDHYPTIGVMAQDVLEKKPEAVVLDTNIGYFRVNYNMI
jgi:hypothetical protein